MFAANTKMDIPGKHTDQLVVINTLGSDVTNFFVCCAAVKHRRTAVLSPPEDRSTPDSPSRTQASSPEQQDSLQQESERSCAGGEQTTADFSERPIPLF